MYFRNYGLRKTCLNKCLKITVSEDTSATSMVKGTSTVEIKRAPPLAYSLIIVNAIGLGQISFTDMRSLKCVR